MAVRSGNAGATDADEPLGELPAGSFTREDEERDGRFYDAPRFVQHIDEGAIAAVTETIRQYVRPGAEVLDLMSSWVSHLPPAAELPLGRVAGLGMNAGELAANPRLDEWVVHDLNHDPWLPYPDSRFDATLITVSIQYLTRPVPTLRQVARVLRPGGVVIVSFSNRMFATKAVRLWRETPEAARPALVARYLALAGGFEEPTVVAYPPSRRWFGGGDPLWTVVTRRVENPPGAARGERGGATAPLGG
jgi:SAM-dependent methyltransferase